MTLHAEGSFEARIVGVDYEEDRNEKDGIVLCFKVELQDGHETTARHRTKGDYAYITREIVEKLGLTWPAGILEIDKTVGQNVPVRIKHKANRAGTQMYENAYIAFGGAQNKPAAPEFVKSAVEKMGAPLPDDDDIPF